MDDATQPTKTQKQIARRAAGVRNNTPVEVIADSVQPPTEAGEGFYHTNRSGARIAFPNAYAKRGWSSLVYHRSTYRVVVGSIWLAHNGGR